MWSCALSRNVTVPPASGLYYHSMYCAPTLGQLTDPSTYLVLLEETLILYCLIPVGPFDLGILQSQI